MVRFVVRASTNLSRIVLLGLATLLFLHPRAPERYPELAPSSNVEAVPTHPAPSSGVSIAKVEPPPLADTKPAEAPIVPPIATETKPAPAPLPPAQQKAPEWTDKEIADAKAECGRLLDKVDVVTEPLPPERRGACGAPAPRELRSVGKDKVRFTPPATLRCPMIAALNTWISDKLQPAARKKLGSPIVRIVSGSYSCRNRYGLARAPISEHAFMNAIDISAFVLEDGRVIRVSKSWTPPKEEKEEKVEKAETEDTAKPNGPHHAKGKAVTVVAVKLGAHDIAPHDEADKTKKKKEDDPKEATKIAASQFLHQAHDDACKLFGTVLGPDTNAAHHNHFHLDMKARKYRSICQ
jgi:hypothetical protein